MCSMISRCIKVCSNQQVAVWALHGVSYILSNSEAHVATRVGFGVPQVADYIKKGNLAGRSCKEIASGGKTGTGR